MQEEPEKQGIFTGRYCINPFNGEKIPIYVANFVLIEYGTGAVMAVPAHDERDFEFAKKYDLKITPVVIPAGSTLDPNDHGTSVDNTRYFTKFRAVQRNGFSRCSERHNKLCQRE